MLTTSSTVLAGRRWWIALLVLGMVLATLALRLGGSGADRSAELSAGVPAPQMGLPADPVAWPVTGASSFNVSTLNVLGADHTAPGGNRRGYQAGETRMRLTWQLMKRHAVDVIGFQELQQPQFDVLEVKAGAAYDWFPGDLETRGFLRNSIAWRQDRFTLVDTTWLKVPYFKGEMLRMPVVLLRDLQTGQQIYFMNFQNPANTRGNAEKWRLQGQRLQMDLVNGLRARTGLPVFWIGDMNSKEQVFCRVTKRASMVSANGGLRTLTRCVPPRPLWVDWIFATSGTTFSGYLADRSPKVRKATDHPMIVARATVQPVEPLPASIPVPTPTVAPTTSTPLPTGSPTPTTTPTPAR